MLERERVIEDMEMTEIQIDDIDLGIGDTDIAGASCKMCHHSASLTLSSQGGYC